MPQRGNVHDLFFKQSISEPGVAADFVRHYLPANVAATLDLDSIQLLSGSFVEERLRGRQSDLLFQGGLRDGGVARLYLLFEHKSRRDPMAILQLLSYCLRIWERDMRDDPRIPLRPIIPILVYHGKRPWNVPTDFGGLFSGPEALRAYWPTFSYQLLDLHSRPPAQVTGDLRLRLPLLLLQAIFRADLPAQLVAIAGLLRQHSDQVLVQTMLLRLLSYAGKASDAVTEEHMEAALLAAEPEEGANIMPTLAQQWMTKGRVEGRVEGRTLGREEGLQEGQVRGSRSGLLRGIEVALDIKFGAAGLALLPEIRAIPDVALLEAVLGAVRGASSVEALQEVYRAAS